MKLCNSISTVSADPSWTLRKALDHMNPVRGEAAPPTQDLPDPGLLGGLSSLLALGKLDIWRNCKIFVC